MLQQVDGYYSWCVKVPKRISPSGQIYVQADVAKITSTGDLVFWSSVNEHRPKPVQNLVLAKGSWFVFYVASVIDGGSTAITSWKGEIEG